MGWFGRRPLPAWIRDVLDTIITPDEVKRELRNVAKVAVADATLLYMEQLRFAKIEAKIEAQLQRDRERGSLSQRDRARRSLNQRTAAEVAALAYSRYVQASGDVSHELLGDNGRAFRAGLLAYERRHRRAALLAERASRRRARAGKSRAAKRGTGAKR